MGDRILTPLEKLRTAHTLPDRIQGENGGVLGGSGCSSDGIGNYTAFIDGDCVGLLYRRKVGEPWSGFIQPGYFDLRHEYTIKPTATAEELVATVERNHKAYLEIRAGKPLPCPGCRLSADCPHCFPEESRKAHSERIRCPLCRGLGTTTQGVLDRLEETRQQINDMDPFCE